MLGKVNEIMYDDFVVLNTATSTRVTGLTSTGFTKVLYNPSNSEVSGSIPVSIAELGNGIYRLSYTPNAEGLWNITIFHSTYFPEGKTANHQIYSGDIDDVKTQTDKLNFSGTDVKATLDGEKVNVNFNTSPTPYHNRTK